jgi:hypothetical protein
VASTGRHNMPSFASSYSANELNDVAGYVLDVLSKQKP